MYYMGKQFPLYLGPMLRRQLVPGFIIAKGSCVRSLRARLSDCGGYGA